MIYNYRCQVCDYRFEAIRSVENRNNTVCIKCGRWAKKTFTLGQNIQVFIPYFDRGLDKQVDSMKDKRAIMKEQGCAEDSSAGMPNIVET